jgi:hypothetical protein
VLAEIVRDSEVLSTLLVTLALVQLLHDAVSVTLAPATILVGFADKLAVGAGLLGVVVPPVDPPPPQAVMPAAKMAKAHIATKILFAVFITTSFPE